MFVEIEDFETNWYGIKIGLNDQDINTVIQKLEKLRDGRISHFHFISDYEGEGGVGDIELYIENNLSNMEFG